MLTASSKNNKGPVDEVEFRFFGNVTNRFVTAQCVLNEIPNHSWLRTAAVSQFFLLDEETKDWRCAWDDYALYNPARVRLGS